MVSFDSIMTFGGFEKPFDCKIGVLCVGFFCVGVTKKMVGLCFA